MTMTLRTGRSGRFGQRGVKRQEVMMYGCNFLVSEENRCKNMSFLDIFFSLLCLLI